MIVGIVLTLFSATIFGIVWLSVRAQKKRAAELDIAERTRVDTEKWVTSRATLSNLQVVSTTLPGCDFASEPTIIDTIDSSAPLESCADIGSYGDSYERLQRQQRLIR